jgi:hypothetical protein
MMTYYVREIMYDKNVLCSHRVMSVNQVVICASSLVIMSITPKKLGTGRLSIRYRRRAPKAYS